MARSKKPVVKTYPGKQEQAQKAFLKDKEKMASKGYFPTSENWEQGTWGCGGFLLALLLCFVVIGFIVFIYMLLVKPAGKLTVTYEHRSKADLLNEAEFACPMCAETIKKQAKVCRFCGHEFKK